MNSYLDTTIFREILFGHEEIRDNIISEIDKNPKRVISYHVQSEFFSGLVKDFINFYFLFKQDECKTLNDAIAIWQNHFSSRKLKNILTLLGRMVQNDSDSKDKAVLLANLKLHIKNYIDKFFSQFDEYAPNKIKCDRLRKNFPSNGFSDTDMKNFIKEIDRCKPKKCNAASIVNGVRFRIYWGDALFSKFDFCIFSGRRLALSFVKLSDLFEV